MRVHAPLRVGGLSSEDPPRRCRSPYEKRILDMIKTGGASSEKRMYKYAKQRLGTHKRALKKREDMKDVYAQMRARQAMEK